MKRFCMVKSLCIALAALVLFLSSGVSNAHAWWDEKWQFRKKISFDTTDKGAAIKENVTDAPILVRLHTGNFTFENAKEDGSDIRFIASDDKMPLKFHVESYDPKKQIALVWVRLPQLSGAAASDSVWLYYGNDSASAGQDGPGTYDTAQALILHLGEADGTPKDATGYANHAAEFSGKPGVATVIGGGASFEGAGGRIVVKRAPSLKFDKGFTFSAWVKMPQAQGDGRLFSWDDGGQTVVVGIAGAKPYAQVGAARATAGADVPLQSWHHLAVTAEPGKQLLILVDGREAGAAPLGTSMPSPASELAFGAALDGRNPFLGELDEVQLSSAVRPAGWLVAAVGSQGQDGKLMTYGQEESGKGGGENETVHILKVIAKSVTPDGWVIIGLCTFMLFLSAYVFVRKFIALQNLVRANREFTEAFDNISDPLEIDAESDEHAGSSLFRIYRAGYREIARWTNRQDPESTKGMSRAAISIFETALDRASVRETQELNSWMIVLTLGISGGP
ncbi:MAG: DUF2341 domain-containing protein, partial [Holophaga sp.]|nr:DUF2341 domain-containing protein [Holophaga sp.]